MEKYITKNGKIFTIRQPTENTAKSMSKYSKILLASTNQIITTSKDLSFNLNDIKTLIKNLDKNPNSLNLIAEVDNQVVGLLIFTPNSKIKMAHTGEFIVNVHPDFQHNGIGKALINTLLGWAKLNNSIEKVCALVLDTNLKSIKLLKDLRFVEEGRHINAVKQLTGEYIDVLQMYIWVK